MSRRNNHPVEPDWADLARSGVLDAPEGRRAHALATKHIWLVERGRILAGRRRRAGDASASAGDYDCLCLTPRGALRPACSAEIAGCPLAAPGCVATFPPSPEALLAELKRSEDRQVLLDRTLAVMTAYLNAGRRARSAMMREMRAAIAAASRRAEARRRRPLDPPA